MLQMKNSIQDSTSEHMKNILKANFKMLDEVCSINVFLPFLSHQQQKAFENIVGKEEIARNEQFLLFPQCFLLNQKILSQFVNSFVNLYLLLYWKSPKLAYEVKG